MTAQTAGPELAARNRRIDKSQQYVPLVALAVSLVLSLSTGSVGNGIRLSRTVFTIAALGLSAAAVLWVWLVRVPYTRREERKVMTVVYYSGLISLIAVLIQLNPWFAFFGAAGYVHSVLLPKPLPPVGLVMTAALVATAQLGGGIPHGTLILGYLVVTLANAALVGFFFRQGMREQEHEEKRIRMFDELAQTNSRLELALQENAGLHAQLVAQAREAGILDERRRMAGEIHDTLAQGLTGIVAQLEAADVADGDSERRRHLHLARELARSSLAEARRSVQALRPGPLDDARLPDALVQLAEQWQQTSGIPIRVEVDGTPTSMQPALEVVLFRVAQEALANVAKHSGASRAGVTLTYTPDVVALDILDDGSGFDAHTGSGDWTGYGLEAMRSRLRQVGGSLVIETTPGEGTTLSASVPVWEVEDQG
ncbi:MAG TPA: sensor histidine kinase [Actinocrinis sp.]|uniref:sensor histidine kinase n=1 Tax=Actinocrinis sp. TaxID=1920516 RepID=UPI002DDD6CAC|nr:sensor histidine kinase [Actinocrinis sp.]HEV2342642.1 sensor histidine kinase [Actinocrinis sp.]